MATGRAGTLAIWSPCVSNGDLVTVVLDIEKERVTRLGRDGESGGLVAEPGAGGRRAVLREPADLLTERADPFRTTDPAGDPDFENHSDQIAVFPSLPHP